MRYMSRRVIGITLGLLVGAATPGLNAGWHEFWNRVHLDFHRNNCWPEPFESIDRKATREPFAAMVSNGWRLQNTLGGEYFEPETQQLTDGGRRQVHWILTNVPEEHRTIYIAEDYDPTAIERRIDAVQQEIARLSPNRPMPAVVATPIPPRGWSADYIDAVDRKIQATIPNPRLPSFKAAGGN
jgi:hypothetical protein